MTKQITLNSTANIRDCMEAIMIDENLLSTVEHMYINSGEDLKTCIEVLFEIELQVKRITITHDSTIRCILGDYMLGVTIAIACPHLEQVFITNYNDYPRNAGISAEEMYAGVTDKIRWQLSAINLLEETRSLGFLTGFPSLEHIQLTRYFNRMLTWLPLFAQNEYTLKSIRGEFNEHDVENFEENYVVTRIGRSTTIQKLAAIETLDITDHKFCIRRIKFLMNYFTGIKNFKYTNFKLSGFNDWDYLDCPDEEELQHKIQQRELQLDMVEEFIDYITDIDIFDVKFIDISTHDFKESFDCIFASVFNKIPKDVRHVDTTLTVHMKKSTRPNGELKLKSYKPSSRRLCRMVEIQSTEPDNFCNINYAIQDALKSADCGIDTFCCLYAPTCPPQYLDGFQAILQQLPAVSRVVMGVPPDGFTRTKEFDEREYSMDCAYDINLKFRQVKDLELNATTIVTNQFTFDLCIAMFPTIKNLRLNYFTGIWSSTANEFSVPLQKNK